MSDPSSTRFPHRRNPDGSFDSICPGCYQTIDNRRLESELAETELTHSCYPLDLRRAGTANSTLAEEIA